MKLHRKSVENDGTPGNPHLISDAANFTGADESPKSRSVRFVSDVRPRVGTNRNLFTFMATAEDKEELLLSCRYGDIEDVRQFVDKFGAECLESARDENGNTALHMICANGHDDILDYLLPKVKPDFLMCRNNAGSTPLHWAALNKHLSITKKLVEYPAGPGALSINCKNLAGRSPLAEAELSEWEEGALWLTSKMQSEDDGNANEAEEEISADDVRDIEVEIQDADGGVARMTLSSSKS